MGWKEYWVYLLTNFGQKSVYTGMTNSLQRRMWEHKNGLIEGFTKTYHCDRLVYFERYTEVTQAIAREKQIKGWTRAKKDALIVTMNPDWNDLAADWYREDPSPSSRLRMTPQASDRTDESVSAPHEEGARMDNES